MTWSCYEISYKSTRSRETWYNTPVSSIVLGPWLTFTYKNIQLTESFVWLCLIPRSSNNSSLELFLTFVSVRSPLQPGTTRYCFRSRLMCPGDLTPIRNFQQNLSPFPWSWHTTTKLFSNQLRRDLSRTMVVLRREKSVSLRTFPDCRTEGRRQGHRLTH